MKRILFSLTIMLLTITVNAQDKHLIDSLETLMKKYEAAKREFGNHVPALYDSAAVLIFSELSNDYSGNDNTKAMDYANQCLSLSEQIGYKKGMGKAYNCFGNIYTSKGDYIHALEMHNKALKIREEIKDKSGIADSYTNIGNVYLEQGLSSEALKNFFISLKSYEEYADKSGLACCYHNIGSIYQNEGNKEEALKNYFAALKINKETGNKQW
ncbi:MAG: tetratricopeptide repeat protein, partial [Bacteroidota bacterium]